MKKIVFVLVLLLVLTSCKQEITTYKEVIKDGKVEIDGISYDINEMTTLEYTYDENDNLIKQVNTSDRGTSTIEYVYENNILIEDHRYIDDELPSPTYYTYENEQLIETKYFTRGFELITKYSYGDKIKTVTGIDYEGKVGYTTTAYLDESGNTLSTTTANANGEVDGSSTYYYDNDQLVKIVNESVFYNSIINYEYNNIGDNIMEYVIHRREVNYLLAIFYDYDYYDNMLPKTVTKYQVRAIIEEEDIRDY